MQQLNEQLLITFECVSAIGTSLHMKDMVEQFFKSLLTQNRSTRFGVLGV